MTGVDEQYKAKEDDFHIGNGNVDRPVLVSSTIIDNLDVSATKSIYQVIGGSTFVCDLCKLEFQRNSF